MSILNDLHYGARQLAKAPGFSFVAVFALALGIGANTALFSIVEAIFLRPLPFPHAEQLVHLTSSLPDLDNAPFSYPRYKNVRDGQHVFSDIGAGAFSAFTATGAGDPEQVVAFEATASYLTTLGMQPLLGRGFSREEDLPGGASVVLLSHKYWQQRFNGDRGVLGQAIALDGRAYTVIGVLPPAMSRFPYDQVAVWTPRPEETTALIPQQLQNGTMAFDVVARLKTGVGLDAAREQVRLLATNYARMNPNNVDGPAEVRVNPLLEDFVGNQRRTYVVLFGAVGCVLLIACANVANLLLARFTGRRKEIALRFALGARRGQVVRQLVLESLLVAVSGALIGMLLANWAVSAFVQIGADFIPRSAEIALSAPAVGFAAGLAIVTGIGMGLLPALQAARQDTNEILKDSSRGSSAGRVQNRLRSGLLVAEVALSLVLLIAASLLLRSFARLQQVSVGFDPDHVFAAVLNVPATKYRSPAELAAFYTRLLEKTAALPGVKATALNDAPPLSGNANPAPIAVVGRPLPLLRERSLAIRHLVSPGSFAALGITLQQGRDFSLRDNTDAPHTVIINESFAKRHFPGENPVGQRIVTGMSQLTAEIIGVVSDTRTANLNTPTQPEYFLPVLQRPENFTCILVRTAGDPGAVASAVRGALRDVDAGLALTNPQTMRTMIARSIADRRLAMVLLGSFAGLAMLLASIGVYSVMAYVVTQRTGEIGIRLALGATPARIQSMILGQGMKLVGCGVALGLVVAFAAMQVMSSLLFEVGARDPVIYAAIAGLIGLVAAAACWIPARRATGVDPMIALRIE